MSVKVRLQSTLYAFLIVVMVVVFTVILHLPTLSAICAFLGFLLLFVDTLESWAIGDCMCARFLSRSLATKFFNEVFGVIPPARRDWLAMKVCQRVVANKLTELREIRDKLFQEENGKISVPLTPEEVAKRVAENRELHGRVEVAKKAYDEAKWLADFFGFDTWRL